MRDHPGPDECCEILAEGAPGIRSCSFSARMAQQGTGSLGFSWLSGRGTGLVSQGSGISWLCDAANSGGVLGAQIQVAAAQGMAVRAQPGQEGRERLVEAVPGGLQDGQRDAASAVALPFDGMAQPGDDREARAGEALTLSTVNLYHPVSAI